MCRSPSKRYARRTIGPCTSRDFLLDSHRSTPISDGYARSPVHQSVDNASQRSTSDGRYSISSSTYSPVSRQPVNSWVSRPNSTGLSASPPNASDSATKSGNSVALRSTLPADYKPSGGYGSASRGSNLRSNSSSSSSISAAVIENRPRSTRSPATGGGDSTRTDDGAARTGEPNYGSMTRRRLRTYNSARTNGSGSGRRGVRHEPRASPNESSEWQVILIDSYPNNLWFASCSLFFAHITRKQ